MLRRRLLVGLLVLLLAGLACAAGLIGFVYYQETHLPPAGAYDVIIVCGAQGANEPCAEGDLMRDWLLERGVPPEDVIAETASFNTRENLAYARAIMQERGLSQALVVTSDYHVARALALCRQAGIEATGKGSPSKPEYFIKNHIREGLSWIKLWLEGR